MGISKKFILTGAALIAVAALLAVPVVAFAYQVVDADTPPGQSVLFFIEAATRFTNVLLPPLGAAFLTAGLVIWHMDRRRGSPAELLVDP